MEKIRLCEEDIKSMVFSTVKKLIREGMYPTRFEYVNNETIFIDPYDLEEYSEEVTMIFTEDLKMGKIRVKIKVSDGKIIDWALMDSNVLDQINEPQFELIHSVIGNYLKDNAVDIMADIEVRKEDGLN